MLTSRGQLGLLKVGYQRAIKIRSWCLTCQHESLNNPTISVTGWVDWVDDFWKTQSPVDIGLWMGTSWWVWEKVTVTSGNLKPGARIEITGKGDPVAIKNWDNFGKEAGHGTQQSS